MRNSGALLQLNRGKAKSSNIPSRECPNCLHCLHLWRPWIGISLPSYQIEDEYDTCSNTSKDTTDVKMVIFINMTVWFVIALMPGKLTRCWPKIIFFSGLFVNIYLNFLKQNKRWLFYLQRRCNFITHIQRNSKG